MKNKGQMFLITAVIIIVILVLLKTSINLPDILQREKELKSRFEKEFFSNIVDELFKVIDISYHQSNNITNNVFDFGNFTRKKMTERLQTFNFFYVGAITPTNQTSTTMNVTVINLLNKNTSVTLNLNGTIKRPTPTATATAVDTISDVGYTSSIAIDSLGYVHISHRNNTGNGILRYCNNTLSSWTCTDVESTSGKDFAWTTSIAIDSNDKVHISHFENELDDLRYCNNTLSSWTCTDVDTTGNVGFYNSIAIDSNDKVHISYQDTTNTDLKYCNNTLGSWTCTDVSTTGDVGFFTSIAIDSNDKVHISHFALGVNDLRYCNNTLGSWTCTDVDTTGVVGQGNSIAIDSNDKVHISYERGLNLGYCNNTLGSWTCTDVDTTGGLIGLDTSIAIDSNDKVHISHDDATNNDLRYCYTTDLSTWNCQQVDNIGSDPQGISAGDRSIAIKKGRLCDSTSFSPNVHISYHNGTTDDLMYAKIAFQVEDSSSWDTNFTITQGNDYTLIVDYDDNQENITIGTKVNKSIYVGFFGITLTGSETTYKDKFQKNYTLP